MQVLWMVQWILVLCCFCNTQALASCKERTLQGSLDEGSLIHDLATLSAANMQGRKSGTLGNKLARQFIQQRFLAMGLQIFPAAPSYVQNFTYPNVQSKKQGANVIGWVEGQTHKNNYIVVTAHYDHLGERGRHVFYGADDNASGVAALLELAALTANKRLASSVIFVATDAEEQGLHGAKAFIKALSVSKKSIGMNINLDMLGEGGRKRRLYTTTTRKMPWLTNLVADVAELAPLCLINGHKKSQRFKSFSRKINWQKASDHAAFAKAEIPYVFVGGGIHSRYHSTKDNFDNIDKTFYVAAVETAWLLLQAADSINVRQHPTLLVVPLNNF